MHTIDIVEGSRLISIFTDGRLLAETYNMYRATKLLFADAIVNIHPFQGEKEIDVKMEDGLFTILVHGKPYMSGLQEHELDFILLGGFDGMSGPKRILHDAEQVSTSAPAQYEVVLSTTPWLKPGA